MEVVASVQHELPSSVGGRQKVLVASMNANAWGWDRRNHFEQQQKMPTENRRSMDIVSVVLLRILHYRF